MNKSKNSKIIHSGLRMLHKSKARTFFMMLGIIVGIAALTLTMTIGKGIEKKIMDNVSKIFKPNNIVVSAEKLKKEGMRSDENGPNTSLKEADIEAIASQLKGLTAYDILQSVPEAKITSEYSNDVQTTRIMGCSPKGEKIWNKPVKIGSFFDESDFQSKARMTVIGPKIANKLFNGQDPIGKQIRIDNIPFIVKGVFVEQGSDPHGFDLDEDVYMPITTLMRRVTNVDYIALGKFEFENTQLTETSEPIIRQILRERHSLSDNDVDDFMILTPAQVKVIINKMIRIFKVLLPAISAITLIAGVIVIIVLMSVSVNQRISEIGLRKAIGAKNNEISLQFLSESIAVVLFGGIIGMILGFILAKLVSNQLDATFYIPLQVIITGIVILLISGLVAGIVPARKASKCNPVEALKK